MYVAKDTSPFDKLRLAAQQILSDHGSDLGQIGKE